MRFRHHRFRASLKREEDPIRPCLDQERRVLDRDAANGDAEPDARLDTEAVSGAVDRPCRVVARRSTMRSYSGTVAVK